jgi:hypothetical protein
MWRSFAARLYAGATQPVLLNILASQVLR